MLLELSWALSGPRGALEAILKSSWSPLGSSWSAPGASWGPLGAAGALLEPPRAGRSPYGGRRLPPKMLAPIYIYMPMLHSTCLQRLTIVPPHGMVQEGEMEKMRTGSPQQCQRRPFPRGRRPRGEFD